MTDSNQNTGRFSYDGLERDLHERARLGILTSLIANSDGLLFTELKDLCSLTDGNLNRHIGKLKDSGMVEVWKGFKDNRPQTLCRITKAGRQRFLEYIAVLERVVDDAANAEKANKKKPLKGWTPA
jgi:DNA-binding MarR family transcriptional regulator